MDETGSGDDPTRRLGVAVMVTLHEGVDAVVDEVTERVGAASPERHELMCVIVESPGFESLVRTVTSRIADEAHTDRPRGDDDTAGITDLGLELVEDGASAAIVRDAIHATAEVAIDRLVAVADAQDRRARAALRPALAAITGAEYRLLSAFDAAVRTVEDADGTRERRLRQAFLRRVLDGPVRDPTGVTRHAAVLGLELVAPFWLALLVDAGERAPAESFEERVGRVARQIERALPPVVCHPAPREPLTALVVVPDLQASRSPGLADQLADAAVGAGLLASHTSAEDLGSLPAASRHLRLHAPLLERCEPYVGPAPSTDGLFPYRVSRDLSTREIEALVRRKVGPLMTVKRHAGERVATWTLMVRERLSNAEAAERLGVGVRAVAGRRAAIEKLTGEDFKSDLFQAQVASYLFEMYRADFPEAGDLWWSGDDPQ